MDFKKMFGSKWHVWFNHGMGQTDVYAATLEDAEKEALAWCRKQMSLVERVPLSNLVQKVVQA